MNGSGTLRLAAHHSAAAGSRKRATLLIPAVLLSSAPATPPTRTSRSPAVSRPIPTRCCKKPIPLPSQSFLFPRRPARSLRPWLARCLHALAAAAFALALSPPPLLPAHAISIDERSTLKNPYPCEDVGPYYGGLDGLSGDELITKLGAVVSPHASLRYKDVWEALKILDAADADHPETSSEVIEIYSRRAVPKLLAGKPDGWNREHLWPRSYGLTNGPSLTDLHNIRPADINVNSSRGNKYYGECAATSIRCLRPANHEAAPDTETDSERWAPPFQVRGDVARSLMYMAVSYGSGQKDAAPHLALSDSPSIQRMKMGLLSTLLQWNELDPPSRSEQLRNDRVCSLYQHNRNPFVDHPEYANLIWRKTPTKSPTLIRNSPKAWINEFHYENRGKDENEFVELVVHTSLDAKDLTLILYNGSNGRMYRSFNVADMKVFSAKDRSSGYLIYTTFTPLQNGPADGIALVYQRSRSETEVFGFISYEGCLGARDGPAKGIVSVDVMVKESNESSEQDSSGLAGHGIGAFAWRKMAGNATPGKLNAGQMF